jgi:murein DD-endopeptidase MepM/ murein hydrolase activator NlpD
MTAVTFAGAVILSLRLIRGNTERERLHAGTVVDARAGSGSTRNVSALGLPLAGLRPKDILDTFHQSRGVGERQHEAVDIMAPRGAPVLAMTTGRVKKLFTSKPGGLTVYQFDLDEVYCYYFAHLDRYRAGLAEGDLLRRGDVLGYVGSTGNAHPSNPHLHLAIFRLGPEKRWWEGVAINPYPILERLLEETK